MSKLRWTAPASADLLNIVNWLKARNTPAAARVGREILKTAEMLVDFPYAGKPGRSPDTRELGVARFPYVIVYGAEPGAMTSDPEQVAILRVLHTAMSWPPELPGPE